MGSIDRDPLPSGTGRFKRLENIKKKEVERKKELIDKQMSRKFCYCFIFSNQIAFRDFWVPRMKKETYKLRFYQYAPALCDNLAWGGARTVGKSDDCVFSILFKALREKGKETLLTAFRKIHVRERLEDLIGSVLNSPYLRKFFKGDADRSLHNAVLRSPIYSIKFKNGHEIKGVSTGDDPSAVMIQSFHPHNRFIDECLPGDAKVTLSEKKEKSIKEIVQKRQNCKVLSWNGKKLQLKKVINFFEHERKKELIEITAVKYFKDKKKYFRLKCSHEHKILTPQGYVKAKNLTEQNEIFILPEYGK